MGAELAKAYAPARAVFAEVDEALGQSLSTLIWVGPEDQLTLTENAQPALMAVSLAVIRVLGGRERTLAQGKRGLRRRPFARRIFGARRGWKLEPCRYRAPAQDEGRRPCRRRSRWARGDGSLLGADLSQAQELAKAASEGEVCAAANDNAPGQVVISGTRAAIERAVALAPKFGARRAVLLPVSAPFHCALMQPAADVMQEALSEVKISAPAVPLVANVLASADQRPGSHPRPSRRAGDRHGAVA